MLIFEKLQKLLFFSNFKTFTKKNSKRILMISFVEDGLFYLNFITIMSLKVLKECERTLSRKYTWYKTVLYIF